MDYTFVYGMSWKKFKDYARDSYEVHLSDKEAEQYRKRFFGAYPDLPKWHARQKKLVASLGQVRNPIGRIRRLPDINSRDKSKKAEAERQAINSPVQGFGSDLCILSMVQAHNHFPRNKARCIGTVHDAILWEVRDDFVEDFALELKQIMESPQVLREVFNFKSPVPIVTDVEIGDWGMGKGLDDWLLEKHGTLYLSTEPNAKFVSADVVMDYKESLKKKQNKLLSILKEGKDIQIVFKNQEDKDKAIVKLRESWPSHRYRVDYQESLNKK